MTPINVSLDKATYKLAKAKPNFSQWVRDQLRSERNRREYNPRLCRACRVNQAKLGMAYCRSCQIDLGIDLEEE